MRRILTNCGALDDHDTYFGQSAKFKIDESERSITVCGSKDGVKLTFNGLQNALKVFF